MELHTPALEMAHYPWIRNSVSVHGRIRKLIRNPTWRRLTPKPRKRGFVPRVQDRFLFSISNDSEGPLTSTIAPFTTVTHPQKTSTATMTSMAAAIAASLPAQATPEPAPAPAPAKVPARMEGFLDVEASRDVESVKLNSLVS